VGNLEKFYSWLKAVKTSQGQKIHLIVHEQRYNDLACLVYQNNNLYPVNPLFAISTKSAELFPNGMKLLPEHCLTLWISLTRALGEEKTAKLNPTIFFGYLEAKKTWDISMADMSKYEQEIKLFFADLVRSDPAIATKIIEDIHNELKEKFDVITGKEIFYLKKNLFNFLQTVREQDMLPCIIFHFSRFQCEQMAVVLGRDLWLGNIHPLLKIYPIACRNDPTLKHMFGGHAGIRELCEMLKIPVEAFGTDKKHWPLFRGIGKRTFLHS
jgi:superfamily II RNA helicase